MRRIAFAVLPALLGLGACVPPDPSPLPLPLAPASPPLSDKARPAGSPVALLVEPTRIVSRTDADRLLATSGITLQWIGWDERGPVSVRPDERGVWRLSGSQRGAGGGELRVDGVITEIGDGYFTLDGTIAIRDTPDAGRECRADKTWHFAITQNRRYYRLREFEWCDYLTDYIDIYF